MGGADLLLFETITDTLNTKAGIFAAQKIFVERGFELPIMISGTITDLSGRTLSGQTPSAFWYSVRHARPFTIGLNCALGANAMRPHVAELSDVADTFICAYPNAGLPNEFGGYDESPEFMARQIEIFAREGLVNIVGGCCGTTPDHIRAFAEVAARHKPRKVPEMAPLLRLSGLEPFTLTPEIPFVNVGERTNVTGSARFRKLITAGDYTAALEVARDQVQNGAQVIDVNMDEGLIDFREGDDRVPQSAGGRARYRPRAADDRQLEIRRHRGRTEMRAGKPLVNSISMKEGEEKFLELARLVQSYGAAVVVMAFDEQGQADTEARKVEICTRAYKLLTEEVGFPPEDIVFDPNVFCGRHRHRRAPQLRRRLHQCGKADHRDAAACPHIGRRQQPQLLVPRQRTGARGDALGVSLPRHPGRHGYGHRQCRPARRLRLAQSGTARGLRGRDPQPPRRCDPSGCWNWPSATRAARRRSRRPRI